MKQHSAKQKLLIIDDDEATRLLIIEILEGTNVSIIETGCGKEAIYLFEKYSDDIALVLLDIRLPNYNGWELLEHFRQVNPLVPVIALSGILPAELAKKCDIAGFDSYFSKPFEIDAFNEIIRLYLQV